MTSEELWWICLPWTAFVWRSCLLLCWLVSLGAGFAHAVDFPDISKLSLYLSEVVWLLPNTPESEITAQLRASRLSGSSFRNPLRWMTPPLLADLTGRSKLDLYPGQSINNHQPGSTSIVRDLRLALFDSTLLPIVRLIYDYIRLTAWYPVGVLATVGQHRHQCG